MRFWLLAMINSGPVRLASLGIRIVGWLVALSALVIWWGPGETASRPGRAVLGLVLGAALWVIATIPRWLSSEVAAH